MTSLSKPYSPADMAKEVAYLFRHENGDESRPGPPRLEMFDDIVTEAQATV
jgi:hypothetical protein